MSHQRGLTTSPPPSNKIPRQTSAELLDMQLNQLADNHSNGSIQEPFSKQQRPLPGSSNDPVFEWRKKAEVAESKVKFLEDKIKKLAVAVKADRDKSKLLMDELKQRAEAAEERASKLEEKLNELVEVLKVERSKASSVKTSVELKQIVEEQTSNKQVQQLQSKLNESEENLKREKSQSDQFKTKVEYLQAQLDEARDQLARQRSTYQPTSSGVFPGHQQKPRRNKLIGLYDFPGEKAEDLAFTEGEILTLLKKYSGGWWLAEKNGRVGRVPSNFVEEIQSSHRIVVRAKGSYRAEKKGDLGFVEGDMLQVIKTDDDWWVGEKDGKVGWVPSNFLEEIPAAQTS